MRVTSEMISGQVLFNNQRSLARLLKLQGQLSSGRRIEKPSDDPVGTLRDLSYRNELAKNDQYLKNISRAKSWAQNYDTVLSDLKDLFQQAKDLTINMADDHVSSESRIGSSTVSQSIYDQVGILANGKLNGIHVFSGYLSDTRSFDMTANGAVFRGDTGVIKFPIESGTKVAVNLNGEDVFLKQLKTLGADSDLDLAVTSTTLLTSLNSGGGIDLLSGGTFQIEDTNLGLSATIDISGATTLGDVVTAINTQLAPTIPNLTFGISPAGNALELNIDESTLRLVNDGTPLTVLNEGNGIDLSYGKIRVTDGGANTVEVDFNSPAPPTTIGDLRVAFNNQMAAFGPPMDNVSLNIDSTGTALEIIDANGTPLGLQVEEITAGSQTAADLGLVGGVGSSLVGSELRPQYNFTVSEIGGTTAGDLGIVGTYHHDDSGSDLNPILTAATAATTDVNALNNGGGFGLGQITLWQGTTSHTIDLSTVTTVQDVLDLFNNSYLDITAEINATGNGIQITNNDPTRSFTIEDADGGRTSKDLGIYGASDMMGSLAMLTKALKNDDRKGVELLMQNFDDAMDHLLDRRSSTGSSAARLDTTEYRLKDLGLNFTDLLSEVEDADLTDLITRMTTQQNNYQASLLAASQIIQPSLVNFLR